MRTIVDAVQFLLLICLAVVIRAEFHRQIFVRPGGVFHKESIERDGVTCVFEYRCQGGTGENWDLSLMEGISKGHASQMGVPLLSNEFLVDLKKKEVSHVNGKFKNALVHVSSEYIRLPEQDL
nr:unnamed protein product [Spirometra erinaceieuropaei]